MGGIEYKTPRELQVMHRANAIVLETLQLVSEQLKPGVTTRDLDRLAEEKIRRAGAIPAFKGYRGPSASPFPASLCISINSEVVHGIPGKRVVKGGDLVSIDCGAIFDGYVGDGAATFAVGEVTPIAKKLIDVTRQSLFQGIAAIQVGGHLHDIGAAIQQYVEGQGFSVVKQFVGHGIGRRMHEEPQVPNYGRAGFGPKLREGLCIAIEPMVNVGGPEVYTLEDDWTAVTADGSLSAHFEHSVAVTAEGPWILGRDPGPRTMPQVSKQEWLAE